jgi:hypothetical protein
MPQLNTSLHLDMLRHWRQKRSLSRRLRRALKEITSPGLYGLDWGDPDYVEPLRFVRDRYVLPYVNPQHRAVEIGPGGGRWTRYLLGFKELYLVDYHAELQEELKQNFTQPNMRFIVNSGVDFPGIPERSIDFLFSFGTFVHLDIPLIEHYLQNMRPILTPTATVVLHYADKTKIMAVLNEGFSQNTPAQMREMVSKAGFRILEEDLTTMWHSSIVRFGL